MYRRGKLTKPLTLDTVMQFLGGELNALERSLSEVDEVQLTPLTEEPTRPRNGMIRYADGTAWDPGSGEGFYGYEGGTWVKL